jgi:hypothetical protein
MVQVHVPARAWRFKSSLRYFIKPAMVIAARRIGDAIAGFIS